MIDSLCRKVAQELQLTSEDAQREIKDKLTDLSMPDGAIPDVSEWFKPIIARTFEERRKMSKEERLKQFRNDSVDEIDTTDLENFAFRGVNIDADGNSVGRDARSPLSMINKKMENEARMRKAVQRRLKALWQPAEDGEPENEFLTMSREEKLEAQRQVVTSVMTSWYVHDEDVPPDEGKDPELYPLSDLSDLDVASELEEEFEGINASPEQWENLTQAITAKREAKALGRGKYS